MVARSTSSLVTILRFLVSCRQRETLSLEVVAFQPLLLNLRRLIRLTSRKLIAYLLNYNYIQSCPTTRIFSPAI